MESGFLYDRAKWLNQSLPFHAEEMGGLVLCRGSNSHPGAWAVKSDAKRRPAKHPKGLSI